MSERESLIPPVPWRIERGKLRFEFRRGRVLYQEDYIGGDPYAGDAPEHWAPQRFGWKVLRGDGAIMSPEWWRLLLGRGYVHVRFRPFILTWAYYNRRVDVHLRWN